MIETSPEYQEAIRAQFRLPMSATVKWGVIDDTAADDMKGASTNQSFLSDVEGTTRLYKERTYASFDNGGFVLGANQIVVPNERELVQFQGYESDTLSDASGSYAPNYPYVVFNSIIGMVHKMIGLSLTFDDGLGRHPKTIRVQSFLQGVGVLNKDYTVTNSQFIIFDEFTDFHSLRIYWLDGMPNQRARLSSIVFGRGITIDGSMIDLSSGIVQSEEIDPIGRRLPEKTATLSFFDFNRTYDADNPQGMWPYINENTPIDITYTKELPNDGREIINGGRFLLNAMPTIDRQKITINATDAIARLTDTYFRSLNNLSGITLYDMTIKVLQDAGLTYQEYKISEKLKQYTSYAYLPKVSHRDCLKLIAEAAMCILYTDREGLVRIEEIPQEHTGMRMGFWDFKDPPTLETSPLLYALGVSTYTYTLEPDSKELCKIDAGVGEQIVMFSNAENITYTSTGSVSNMRIYGGAATFTVTTPGTVIFYGRKVIEAQSISTKIYNDQGETETVQNQLITTQGHAALLRDWKANYLLSRSLYTAQTYGDPSFDAGDIIGMQTNFTDNLPSRIIRYITMWRGSLSGEIIAKRL